MAPSKAWMSLAKTNRLSNEYELGIDKFIKYALRRTRANEEIKCPCVKCCNALFKGQHVVKQHLIVHGIMQNYTFWYQHGEKGGEVQSDTDSEGEYESDDEEDDFLDCDMETGDELLDLITDFFPNVEGDNAGMHSASHHEEPNENANKFYSLLRDLEQPIYEGSKCSKLSSVMKLLRMKNLGRWSNKSFSMLLKFLKDELLPSNSSLPASFYEAKKMIRDLGLYYKKIDACVNHCMLFWKEDEGLDKCKICDALRWKVDKRSVEPKVKSNGKKIPLKILRYFPLKPRLQRLFMCSKTASNMTWHNDKRVKDGVMRHPADSKAWKHFDELHSDFSSVPRNVRLGLMTDGFQSFNNTPTSNSIWHVVLVPYNLPPWLSMKQENSILSMIIPGPDSPGDVIDVYLQPLIEELKELWESGVETYDASKCQNFNLCAALLWTISDFPAYAMLSGWSTKGKLACPSCHKDTHSLRLQHCCKQVYMRHRRFLPSSHPWRNKKDSFGVTEGKSKPSVPLSGSEVLIQVQDLENIPLTKAPHKKVKISHELRGDNWNKKSIFFELPYWEFLLLRHDLDVMHIEKNVCDNILGTVMNMKGKTKDTINSRLDLQAMNIRPELHPIQRGTKLELHPASFALSRNEKEAFSKFLNEIKVPDGFSSNISRCVSLKECKISCLKSHDCHVLLQRLFPLAIRGFLSKKIVEPLIELSMFFSVLCAKSVRVQDLEQIKKQIPLTLSKLEMCLPVSCFDIMLHLPVHLADEALLCGPVQFRWMYTGERSMHEFKLLIGNMARPEGCMAEGYLINECMTLCSRYLHNIDTKFNRPDRNDDGDVGPKKILSIFGHIGRPLGASKICDLEPTERDQAHVYILKNCNEVSPFYREHSEILAQNGLQLTLEEEDNHFVEWFKNKAYQLYKDEKSPREKELLSLSRGPTNFVTCFSGYITNGYRFHTESHERRLQSQNSGVFVLGNTGAGTDDIDYYGVLTEVIRLEYLGSNHVVLFRCNWWDVHSTGRGVKMDKFGFVSLNSRRFLKTDEPFILASQALQVFYCNDVSSKDWLVVVKVQPRNTYDELTNDELQVEGDPNDMPLNENARDDAFQEMESFNLGFDLSDSDMFVAQVNMRRVDVESNIVDVPESSHKRKRKS